MQAFHIYAYVNIRILCKENANVRKPQHKDLFGYSLQQLECTNSVHSSCSMNVKF